MDSYDLLKWTEKVKEYLEIYENDDSDNIHEYIDGLVPLYYYNIMEEATKLGVYYNEIQPHQVGETIDKILQEFIYEEYFERFMNAYYQYVLSCEKCGNEYSLEMGECDNCEEEE